MARKANKTVATSAVPKAAPIERENCTEAAASPSRNWPAALCTLTCTTPITVPMHNPLHNSSAGQRGGAERGRPKGESHETRGDQTKADDRVDRGQSGLVDQTAGNQRSGADADGERNQQETGLRRRGAAHHLQINRQERDQRNQRRAVTGCQGVAVPDRRLAQQPKRNERRRRAVFMPHQQHQRDQPGGEQPAAERHGLKIDVLHLLEREQRGRDEHREQDKAARIGAPRKPFRLSGWAAARSARPRRARSAH